MTSRIDVRSSCSRRSAVRFFYLSHGPVRICEIESHVGKKTEILIWCARNTTITHCGPTHRTLTATRHEEDNYSKATISLFLVKMIAKLERTLRYACITKQGLNTEPKQTIGGTLNNESVTTDSPTELWHLYGSSSTSIRLKPGIFRQTAKFGQRPCLFNILNIGIKNKLTKQTVKILKRRLIRSRLILIYTVCKCVSEFTWCPNLPDFTLHIFL